MATPEGTLGALPDEILIRIFFEHCADAVSNRTIQRLSTVYAKLIAKYAPPVTRLWPLLFRAGVPFCTGPERPWYCFKRRPFLFEEADLSIRALPFFVGPAVAFGTEEDQRRFAEEARSGRSKLNGRAGAAKICIPGVPQAIFSYLAPSQCRIELLTPHSASGVGEESAEMRWWFSLLDGLQAAVAAEPALSHADRARATRHYALLRDALLPREGRRQTPALFVVSLPRLGAASSATAVHLLVPFTCAQLYPKGTTRVVSRGLVSVGGVVRQQTVRIYRLLIGPAAIPGRLRSLVDWVAGPSVTTYELEPAALVATPATGRVARFKADFWRYRRHRWTTEDWATYAAVRLLHRLQFLRRAFANLAARFWNTPERWIGLEHHNEMRELGANFAAVLAEFTINAIVAPARTRPAVERYTEIFGRVGVWKWKTAEFGELIRICDDIRPLLFGGRLEVMADLGPWKHTCPADRIRFELFLDGVAVLSLLPGGGGVCQTPKHLFPNEVYLRTGRISLGSVPHYAVANASFPRDLGGTE